MITLIIGIILIIVALCGFVVLYRSIPVLLVCMKKYSQGEICVVARVNGDKKCGWVRVNEVNSIKTGMRALDSYIMIESGENIDLVRVQIS